LAGAENHGPERERHKGAADVWGPKDRNEESRKANLPSIWPVYALLLLLLWSISRLALTLAWPSPPNGPINPGHKE
jgi:hypothetical protein